MQDFEYIQATSVDEVIGCLTGTKAPVQLLSGGTDLLVQLREGRKQAGLVVDVKRIPELTELVFDPRAGLTIGAAVACQVITRDRSVAALYPGLVDAIKLIGGTQIQSRASVGGNVCNASPAADAIPALIVHHARCIIAGAGGRREIAVEDFCTAPGRNALQPGELLVSMRVPPVQAGFGAAYLRFIPRNEMDIAVVGAGASVQLDEHKNKIVSARVAVGAVAPVPLLVAAAGAYLAGREVTPDCLLEAARIARDAASPIDDMRGTTSQRRQLTMVLVRRALTQAVERARGDGKKDNGNGLMGHGG